MTDKLHPILAGIRVLDFTRVMSGPYCTSMFSDLGAEIIKVESPGVGDISREVGTDEHGDSRYFSMLNRNKKSVTLNLKHPEAIKLAKAMAARSDIVVENFRPGVMRRLGIDYDSLCGDNPRLIYASINGFGSTGSFAGLPAFDLVVQAMSGLMNMTGAAKGPATAVGESITDVAAGMFAAWGIMTALYDREKTGRGQHIEIAMLDSIVAMLLTGLSKQLGGRKTARRSGNRHPETYPVDGFTTTTGDIVLVCFGDGPFRKLCEAIGQETLATDPRFVTNDDRNQHEDELRDIIAAWAITLDQDTALAVLREAGIPSAPVWSFDELIGNGYVAERGLFTAGKNGDGQETEFVQQPVRFATGSRNTEIASPSLGQQTAEVLTDCLGLSEAKIQALAEDNAI